MSSIQQRLTDILAEHDCYDYAGGLDCRCGESFVGDDNNAEKFWAAHVAAVLVQELGLTQEFDSIPEWEQPPYSGDYPRIVSWRQGTRYVTDWETA